MPETIKDRVLKVIANTQRIPPERVTPDSTFEELGIDSMDSINILFDLESEFDIEINDEDAKKISTIREMIDGVTYLVEAKHSTSQQS
jgi:acyl carrier protein